MIKRIVTAIILLAVIAGLAAAALYGYQYMQGSRDSGEPVTLSEDGSLSVEETEKVLSRISELLVVPNDTNPLVATIINVEELQAQQLFYQNAKNGDILIIYPTVQKAIIYNPQENILVNVGPVILDQQ